MCIVYISKLCLCYPRARICEVRPSFKSSCAILRPTFTFLHISQNLKSGYLLLYLLFLFPIPFLSPSLIIPNGNTKILYHILMVKEKATRILHKEKFTVEYYYI